MNDLLSQSTPRGLLGVPATLTRRQREAEPTVSGTPPLPPKPLEVQNLTPRWPTLSIPGDLTSFHHRDRRIVTNPALGTFVQLNETSYALLKELLIRMRLEQPSHEDHGTRLDQPQVDRLVALLVLKPAIPGGTMVQVEECAKADLQVGDVALLRGDASLLVHRVVYSSAGIVATKGDALPVMDPEGQADKVLGRVIAIRPQDHRGALDFKRRPPMLVMEREAAVDRVLAGVTFLYPSSIPAKSVADQGLSQIQERAGVVVQVRREDRNSRVAAYVEMQPPRSVVAISKDALSPIEDYVGSRMTVRPITFVLAGYGPGLLTTTLSIFARVGPPHGQFQAPIAIAYIAGLLAGRSELCR